MTKDEIDAKPTAANDCIRVLAQQAVDARAERDALKAEVEFLRGAVARREAESDRETAEVIRLTAQVEALTKERNEIFETLRNTYQVFIKGWDIGPPVLRRHIETIIAKHEVEKP